jgi:hypothetical protein
MKSKGHIYIYISIPRRYWEMVKYFFILISFYYSIHEKNYMFLGLSLSSDSGRLKKS